jgi:uncharacterized membrane protein YphA (DoxX/SURF4 family)
LEEKMVAEMVSSKSSAAPVVIPAADAQAAPVSRKALWAGRILTGLMALMLLFSAVMKLLQPEDVLKEFARLGYPETLALAIGIVEIACAVLYVIPRTSILGAILLTGYLGGATATHVRIGDAFLPPVIIGILIWLSLYLRDRRLRALVPLRS